MPTSAPALTTAVRVDHAGGDRFDIQIRGHTLRVDQPVDMGGEDTAPTPTELLVASLASCVAFYARRYLSRHGLPTEGLAVRAAFELGYRPARVASIDVELTVPPGVPESRRQPLLAMASHCTVHSTLSDPPAIRVALA
jgi:putative redox protein